MAEITWRATQPADEGGNFVVVPNNIISKEAITNYSEPSLPTRLQVDVGVSYGVPPNDVKAAMHEAPGAGRRASSRDPTPEVLIVAFADSAITYRVRFWIEDFATDMPGKGPGPDRASTTPCAGGGIEIPFPMQIQYERIELPGRPPERTAFLEQVARGVDMLAPLSDAERADAGCRIRWSGCSARERRSSARASRAARRCS